MFLLAPDGHLLSRRWRYAAWAVVLGVLLCAAALLTTDPTQYDVQARTDAAGRCAGSAVLARVPADQHRAARLARLDAAAAGAGAQGEQRQQVRLIAASAALVSIGLVALFVVQRFNGGTADLGGLTPAVRVVPAAADPVRGRRAALPALRHRGDHQPDRGARGRLGLRGGSATRRSSSRWGSWSTGRPAGSGCPCWPRQLVALAFQPLRRQVTRLANRLAYGSRAQPYEALSDFSRRLAETPSADALLPAVAEAAGRAVSARRATATLEASGAPVLSAAWGDAGAEGTDPHVVPVRHGGAVLGSIEVHVPRGRPVSDSDERLLDGPGRPDRGGLPQHRPGGRARRARGRARPDHPGARAIAGADHRGGRRRPPRARGRDRARGAAAPRRAARAADPVPDRRRGRPAA